MDVLKDKYYLDSPNVTRYSNIPIYYNTLFNNFVYGTSANLSRLTDYLVYIVRLGDTWDSIALEFYGNPCYYWVLCNFNGIIDPFIEPKEGIKIAVPSLSNLEYLTN